MVQQILGGDFQFPAAAGEDLLAPGICGIDQRADLLVNNGGHLLGVAGMTISLPDEDKAYQSKKELTEQIARCLGGRVAEQLVLGDISTGAGSGKAGGGTGHILEHHILGQGLLAGVDL